MEKAQDRIKFLADLEKAEAFHRKLLSKHVMSQFRNIIRWKIRNQNVSDEMQQRNILRKTFSKWQQHYDCVLGQSKEKAIAFHNRHCLKIAWSKWQKKYRIAESKKWSGIDWFELRITERVFRAWSRLAAETRSALEIKKTHADAHFNW